MSYLNTSEKNQLTALAGKNDLYAQGWKDHELHILSLRAGKEGVVLRAKVATTANHALTGLTAIDGVTPVAGDIIFARLQTDTIENGLYVAAAGAWSRLKDSDNQHVLKPGSLVVVEQGTLKADTLWLITANTVVVGTNNITVAELNVTTLASSLAAITTGNGAALVGIEDPLALLAALTVETAIEELAKKAPITLADPGTGAAIPVTRSATVLMTTGGSGETGTLAIPTFAGQQMILTLSVDGGGNRVVTSAQDVTPTPGENVMTFDDAGDYVVLVAVPIAAGALRWRVMLNNGVTIS